MIEEKRLAPGTLLDGRYRIVKLIKAGGMGAVYQAEDLNLDGKLCAMKEMLDSFTNPADRAAAIDRFVSEIQVLGSLRHPNIPQVSDHFLEGGSFYFVMEYIEGRDLATFLATEGTPGLPEKSVLEWAIQVCEALEYLHSLKPPIVHRDIKPSNLILRHRDGRILLIDFGIARVTPPQEGYWIGTPGYAPPEQQVGRPEPRSDLYALGATIHELLTGKKPKDFVFPSFEELGVKISVPALEEILLRALMWNPEERIGSATELKEMLLQVLGYSPVEIATNSEFAFTVATQKVKEQIIDPILKKIMTRYGNECYTRFLPKSIDYLVFTLGYPTPFEMIIRKNDEDKTLEFFEKQGLLDKVSLGKIDPQKEEDCLKIRSLVDQFLENYENFKNAGWQMSI